MSSLDSVRENGFALLPQLFPAEAISRVLEEIDRSAPTRSRAGIRHALRLPPVARIAKSKRLVDFAREVLGPDASPFRATMFEKSPMANWLIVWHQDTALPLRRRLNIPCWGPWSVKEGVEYAHAPAAALSQILALRVHLDNSTVTNGPLRVLPGTHNRGVLSDDQIHQLAEEIAPIECTCAKGAVVAMRPLLVHASSKSQNGIPRRVLHIEYAASDTIASPLELAQV